MSNTNLPALRPETQAILGKSKRLLAITNKILANKVVKKTPPPPKVVHKISTDQNKAIEFSDNIEAWIDADTGLMWEVKTAENIKHGYVWSKEWIKNSRYQERLTDDVKDTFSYAQKLNANNHGGFSDWRVPTHEELKTVYTKEKNNGYYIKYPLSKNTASDDYWSSTATGVWIVNFNIGYQGRYRETNSYYVRCVRAGQKIPSNSIPIINIDEDDIPF